MRMATLSFRVPDSLYDELEELAEEEDVSVSEIARESVLDGVGLRSGRPVVLPDGGTTLVSQVDLIEQRGNYFMATMALLGGIMYSDIALAGSAETIAMTMLAVAGLAILASYWLL